MSAKHLVAIISLFSLAPTPCRADHAVPEPTEIPLEVRAFEPRGPLKGLEQQVLDLRYSPQRWQACIGLPDDPHKSIVGSDGGLYYDYGGGRFYDFNIRVQADLETEASRGDLSQHLLNPRTPVVITEQQCGRLLLRQRAWAAAPQSPDVRQWSERRVDYLWLEVENTGDAPQRGRLVLKIDSDQPLKVSRDMEHVGYTADGRTFCVVSPACVSCFPEVSEQGEPAGKLRPRRQPSVSLNWGRPSKPCDERFRHILVGYNRPLQFTFTAEPGKDYRVVFGLIESWHEQAGKRPLELRVEGRPAQKIDLIAQYGRHVPVALAFDARDQNADGLINMGVYAGDGAEDNNTILTALWVFDSDGAPPTEQVLLGQADSRALAIYDTDSRIANPLALHFVEKNFQPADKQQVLIALCRGSRADVSLSPETARRELDRAVRYWNGDAGLPFDRICVPDSAVQGLLDSCIRNIYQARELRNGRPAFQVGPTCYRGTWAADGPFILEAVTYLGRADEVRAGLELQVTKDEGPGGVAFSKKCGLRLWMILRHWRLTGDRVWLEKMWPHVQSNVNQIIEYRRMTMDDRSQANYGLMPIGFGDGGLGGSHREYTNVYWTLAGIRAAMQMAEKLDKPVLSAWKAEFEDYWGFFDKARNRDKLNDGHGNVYVPVTMKGEQPQLPQRGAWAFLQSIYPGRIFRPDDALMQGTMAMLDANQREGLIFGTGWDPQGIWNYAGSFYGHAHLWLGHGRKAASTLYAFGNHACPLLCWREEQNPAGDPQKYVGDMPHNWASAEFIRLVRHMLILERGRQLHLLEAMPRGWSGAGDVTELKDIATSFGPMNLSLRIADDGRTGLLRITPPRREPVEKLVVHLENFLRPVKSVRSEGAEIRGETVVTAPNREILLTLSFE